MATITSGAYNAATDTLVVTTTGVETTGSFDLTKLALETPDTDGTGPALTPGSQVLTGATVSSSTATTLTIVLTAAQATAVEAWNGTTQVINLNGSTGWHLDASNNPVLADATGNVVTGIQE